jgi:hypothetical protein
MTGGQGRSDQLSDVLGAGRGHQERFGPVVETGDGGIEQEVADAFSDCGTARLPRQDGAERMGKPGGLGGFA